MARYPPLQRPQRSSFVCDFVAACLLFAVFTLSQDVVLPYQLTWSPDTYGPDGPWHAVRVYAGVRGHGNRTDLFPGGFGASTLFNANYCITADAQNGACPGRRGSFYNLTKSVEAGSAITFPGTYRNELNQPPSTNYFNLNFTENAVVFDSMNIGTPTAPNFIPNATLQVWYNAYRYFPNGSPYPLTLGFLDLGWPYFSRSYASGGINYTSYDPPDYLYNTSKTPSSSVSLHYGSVSKGIPPSMFYGGYDQSRVIGPVATSNINFQGVGDTLLQTTLTGISIGVAVGGSPFGSANITKLLSKGNSSLNGPLSIGVLPFLPYLQLPRSVCDSIAENLPVTYDEGLNLYLWNTNDSNFQTIVHSPAYLQFMIASSSGPDVPIKIPFSLLNLTLNRGIQDKPTQYFPCSPLNGTLYALGRAFLQGAFLGVNWAPNTPNTTFFLAQAPGPRVPTTAQVVPINGDTQTIESHAGTLWEDTWDGHWTPITSSSGGLSDGAKVGIGVGVGLGVPLLLAAAAGFWFYRRRQKKRQIAEMNGEKAATSTSGTELPSYGDSPQSEDAQPKPHPPPGTDMNPVEAPAETGTPTQPAQLPAEDHQVHEMPGEMYRGMPVRSPTGAEGVIEAP